MITLQNLSNWISERIPLKTIGGFLNKPVPKKLGWGYCVGTIVLVLILVQLGTGIVLTMYYAPTPDHARDSVEYIQSQLLFGKLIRGLHAWGASFIVVLVVLHILHIIYTAGYKKPKQLTWILGVFLGLVIFGFAFTGYLLPWDQKAYWATMVGTSIAGEIPVVGAYQMKLIRAGDELGALTLTRFFSIHAIILPMLLLLLVMVHLWMVQHLGIGRHEKKEPVPESEKIPFFPQVALNHLFSGLFIVVVLLCVAHFFPPSLEKIADPTDKTYNPHPEWYFLFLYQLLHYFEGPLELVGTAVIPAVGFLVLLLLPFLDRSPELSPRKRPAVMGFTSFVVIAVVGLTIQGILTIPKNVEKPNDEEKIEAVKAPTMAANTTEQTAMVPTPKPEIIKSADTTKPQAKPTPAHEEEKGVLTLDPEYVSHKTPSTPKQWVERGMDVYDGLNCAECHTIGDNGGTKAPELTHEANKHDDAWHIKHFQDPRSIKPKSKMPKVRISDEDMKALIAYIQTLQ